MFMRNSFYPLNLVASIANTLLNFTSQIIPNSPRDFNDIEKPLTNLATTVPIISRYQIEKKIISI